MNSQHIDLYDEELKSISQFQTGVGTIQDDSGRFTVPENNGLLKKERKNS